LKWLTRDLDASTTLMQRWSAARQRDEGFDLCKTYQVWGCVLGDDML
jgi:hypothetical protein